MSGVSLALALGGSALRRDDRVESRRHDDSVGARRRRVEGEGSHQAICSARETVSSATQQDLSSAFPGSRRDQHPGPAALPGQRRRMRFSRQGERYCGPPIAVADACDTAGGGATALGAGQL